MNLLMKESQARNILECGSESSCNMDHINNYVNSDEEHKQKEMRCGRWTLKLPEKTQFNVFVMGTTLEDT